MRRLAVGFKILTLLVVLGVGQQAWAQNSCSDIFARSAVTNRLTQRVMDIQNLDAKDTTSLRQEQKFVVSTSTLKSDLAVLKEKLPGLVKARDEAAPGHVNVTSTYYMKVARYFNKVGEMGAVKVRFRKYLTKKIEEPWSALKPAPELADRSWLELKISHHTYDNVVVKLRLLCLDRDIKHLVSENFFSFKSQIRSRLIALNPKKIEDVDKAMGFFEELYSNPRYRAERLFAQTEYQRESLSIKIPSAKNPDEKIDVQITQDSNVHLTSLQDKMKYSPYDRSQTVLEIKVPVAYAELSDANIAEYPALAQIREFVEKQNANHDQRFPLNRGKMSKIEKPRNKSKLDKFDFDVLDDLSWN